METCVCVCYVFRDSSVCVQSEPSGVLGQVSRIGVDQNSSCSVLLSQPHLLGERDPAPDTDHHHGSTHRHAAALQPMEVLLPAVVGINHAPLEAVRVQACCRGWHGDRLPASHRGGSRGAVGTVVRRAERDLL